MKQMVHAMGAKAWVLALMGCFLGGAISAQGAIRFKRDPSYGTVKASMSLKMAAKAGTILATYTKSSKQASSQQKTHETKAVHFAKLAEKTKGPERDKAKAQSKRHAAMARKLANKIKRLAQRRKRLLSRIKKNLARYCRFKKRATARLKQQKAQKKPVAAKFARQLKATEKQYERVLALLPRDSAPVRLKNRCR